MTDSENVSFFVCITLNLPMFFLTGTSVAKNNSEVTGRTPAAIEINIVMYAI